MSDLRGVKSQQSTFTPLIFRQNNTSWEGQDCDQERKEGKREIKLEGKGWEARQFRLSWWQRASSCQTLRERERTVGRTWRKSQNVTFVHFTQALLSVIKHVSSNPRKSEHMLTYRSCQDGPWLGGRGAGSRGQLTLFQTFKQLSHVDYVSPKLMLLRVPEWNWVLLLKWEEQCVLFLYISFSNALITQDFTPMEYSPHLILLSAKSACTHHTLHATHTTLHGEYRTLTIGKDYERLVCYTGDFGLLLSEGKELSRIILVALMRTQDKMEHSGTCTVMALSSRTCRTISLPFGTLRWNESMNEEDTFAIN